MGVNMSKVENYNIGNSTIEIYNDEHLGDDIDIKKMLEELYMVIEKLSQQGTFGNVSWYFSEDEISELQKNDENVFL